MKIVINVAKDYTELPGGRLRTDGKFSGEDFRIVKLIPALKKALEEETTVEINFDGTFGYAPSFLEESFGGAVRELKTEGLFTKLRLVSEDEPSMVQRIQGYMSNAEAYL